MSDYTERFSEVACLLGVVHPAAHAGEQNTGYVSLANYHRAVVLIDCGDLGGSVDVDVEQATDTAGTGAKTLDSGSKDFTIAATEDNSNHIIEIRTEELDVNNDFDCVNVELTPAGTCTFCAEIWGLVPRFPPVPTTAVSVTP